MHKRALQRTGRVMSWRRHTGSAWRLPLGSRALESWWVKVGLPQIFGLRDRPPRRTPDRAALDVRPVVVNTVYVAGTEVSTRDRLVETGRDLFLEVGPSGFSLREVARRTGITAAAVYRHFDDREALLQAVCAEGFRVFGSYLLASLAKDKPLERLRAAGRQYLRFALERPRDYHVIFMSEAKGERHERSETGPETFQFLVDRVRECIHARVLRRGHAR